MIQTTKAIFAALLLTLPLISHARLIQIIHTNDLHSYFRGYYDGRGGYARLQTKIKKLRAEAEAKGIPVLQLDGGDWGEGTSFFISEKGAASVKALGMMGVDAAVIGNHDHMMGGNILGQQIRRANVKTKFISANIVQTPSMNLGNLLTPYVDFNKGNIPIRVIGLSTDAIHFEYQLYPGRILDPVKIGESQGKLAKRAGKELVIALTHIGQSEDVKLAKKSTSIDVIVGGHSHTKLERVKWQKNKRGKQVPIVQAWAHGLVVGTLLLDVKDGGGVKVVDYKLHEVKEPMREDWSMKNFVARSAQNRNQYFGGRWDEVIGESLVPLSGYVDGHSVKKETCWGRHLARMSAHSAAADVGIHLASFEGVYKPAGPVTYGDIVDNFPHFRKYGDPGWEISTILVRGAILRPLMFAFHKLRNKLGINFYGLGFKVVRGKAVDIKLHNKSLNDKALYAVAFPAEVGYALKTTLPYITRRLFPSMRGTGKYYWPSMEQYLQENSPISCQ